MKKLIYTLLIIIALTNNSFSAGTAVIPPMVPQIIQKQKI